MSFEPCVCEGKNKNCVYCKGTGKVFFESEAELETVNLRAFGDSLQDYIK